MRKKSIRKLAKKICVFIVTFITSLCLFFMITNHKVYATPYPTYLSRAPAIENRLFKPKTLSNDEDVNYIINTINLIIQVENTETYIDTVLDLRSRYNSLDDSDKEKITNYNDLVEREAVVNLMNIVNTLGECENTDSYRKKVQLARDTYNDLTTAEKSLVPVELQHMIVDTKTVVEFMDEVNKIVNPEDTQVFRYKVSYTREKYNNLTDNQKSLVPDGVLKVLVDDEAVITVMDKINLIGNVEYKEESKLLIDRADEAYESLTEEQKELVINYYVLTNSMESYRNVDTVYKMIEALNNIDNNEESEKDISAAREAYNSLTEEEKALLPNYEKLTRSELTYNELRQNYKVFKGWMITLIIVGGIILVLAIIYWFLFFVCNEWTIANDKSARVFRVRNREDKVVLIKMNGIIVYRYDNEVYKKKRDMDE